MSIKALLLLAVIVPYGFSAVSDGFYANVSEETMITTVSAALGGSDLSISTGASVEGTPGNLPFDSLNRLSLAYAGYFHNTFSTSILTWSGQPFHNIGISLLAGYIYIPDILDTRGSLANDSGELEVAKISLYSASKMFFRAGIGRRFDFTPTIALGAGVAVNAKRSRLPETGYGISMDAGVKSLFSKPGISLALQVENLTSSYIYWNESFQERSYPHVRAGIGWERYFPYIYGVLRICYSTPDLLANEGINNYSRKDGDIPKRVKISDDPLLLISQGKTGIEYTIFNTVSFRFGIIMEGFEIYRENSEVIVDIEAEKFSFGGGLRLLNGRAGIDFVYITHALAGTYQISVYYNW